MRLRFFFVVVVFFPVATAAQAPDAVYLWPTNSGNFLSSTFGETRAAHYHAGLDIKTWGAEGYKVYASRDGYLNRLSISNTGYGKVIYLKHNDGSYTVYAHLLKFNRKFQSLADSLRMDTYSYEMDGEFEGDSIFVKQGEIIGYTGSTGIGPPHHHFEIRNADNEPVNPLELNLTIKDTIAPSFLQLMIEPLSPRTTIMGSNLPKVIKPALTGKNTYDFGTIPVNGRAGIAANIIDRADDVFNKYSVYELTLLLNDDTLFTQKMSRFSFSQAELMPFDRIQAPDEKDRNFMRLFVKEGVTHPFVLRYADYHNLRFEEPYTIIAKDYFGNTSTATVRFTPDYTSPYEKGEVTIEDLTNGSWNKDWVIFNDTEYLDLTNYHAGILWDTLIAQRIVELRQNPNTTLTRVLPGRTTTITTPDSKISTAFYDSTFFDTVSIFQAYRILDDTLELQLIPENIPVRGDFDIRIFLGDLYPDYSGVNLYRYNPAAKTMSFVNSTVSGLTLRANTSGLGIFRVARDSVPPVIKEPFIRKLGTGEFVISLLTQDDLSGIDFKSAVMVVNNQRGIAEYDFENDKFTFYLPSFRLQRENEIYFKINDKAGNAAEAIFRLSYR